MRIQFTTRHFELKPTFKAYAEDRVLKLKRYFEQIIDVTVILASEKKSEIAEIRLHTNGHDLVGTGEGPEMGAALDQAIDRMEMQLRKHKDRISERKGRQGLGEAMAAGAEVGGDDTEVEIEE